VGTGSWLGRRFQGRGVGTEMRTAVLELAFRGLGAERARSGAVDENIASLRVAEKLGYREIGRGTVAPRGVELPHTDVELRREDWRPPVPVEIEGLGPCLPLFGLPAE
jgi:RimJ/RimL family protein N-acetyltransferase